MKNSNKWRLMLYLVPYPYIGLILDYFGKSLITILIGYLSSIIPFFVIKVYKNKNQSLSLIYIIIGNVISLFISFLFFKFFSNYKEYDYYFKPFGALLTSVYLTTLVTILQIIRYVLILAPDMKLIMIYFLPYYILAGFTYGKSNTLQYVTLIFVMGLILFFLTYIISAIYKHSNKTEFIIFIILGNIISLFISFLIFNIIVSIDIGFIIFILITFILFILLQLIFYKIICKTL
ncbi:MAG: hypothetical protein ACLUCH_02390 [Lachnospirales bacterium]